MLLEQKVCLVTGANRGIGAAIAKRFAEEGAIVYAASRSAVGATAPVDAAALTVPPGTSGAIISLQLDVTDAAAMKDAFVRIKKEQGRLDVLVNNAGIMKDAIIGMISEQLLNETFATNVFAVINAMQLAAKLMQRQSSGSIINIASLVGTNGNKNQLVYAASKGAVIAATKAAAKELAASGIRVNALAPGMIDTDLLANTDQTVVTELTKSIALGRIGKPSEVADACVWLASGLSSYVTGQIIGVDGAAVM
ncbi:MAG: SDR family oxidoreductase [Coriobacteriales bacterium]|jgi:3-oxoacyl-[acyl-carrier protein] reductase|nr:SDR family oxidoreductase [Coriobacteriales bacterium]